MSDRGNVYGGGTYQGGTYQGGGYRGGRHHGEDEDEEQRESQSPPSVDDDANGTLKVARRGAPNTGGQAAQPPASQQQQTPRPPAAPQTYGPGARPQAQPASPARQGQPPASPARGGAAPQPPRPPQTAQQPASPPRPPQPPASQQPTPSQPPAARPPAAPPAAQRPAAPASPPRAQPPAQPPAPPTSSQPPTTSQPPSAPVSAAPVSGPSVSSVSPVSVQPVSGQPVSGQPVSGQPFSSQPASAQPYSGVPYSGAAPMSVSGGPVSSMPTSAGLFGVSQVSAGPTEGTVYGLPVTDRAVETASDAGKAIEPLRSMPQIPTARALELMTSASPPAGLVIGRDAEQVPVVAPFFRPEETRINLIGGVYLARLLVFRALALGTRVAVCTTRPQEWNGLGESATNRNDRLAVLHGDQPVTVEASQHSPALYVYDVGERGSQTKPVLGPWRTQLTVLPRLTNFADNLTSEAHMTVLQRLTAEEAQIARSSIRVNQEVLQWLQMLHDDMIAMLRKGQKEKYLWCAPTSIEAQMFGAPMRTY
ncbi:hypothetical protein [Glycomyces tenuis]|uniref:hypothetical protein n=1 Tax=Glycomyces tenuis TaxID=58116 RepID=UPI0004276BD8|nr:hypothetical protein [Glycomyces tenuis]